MEKHLCKCGCGNETSWNTRKLCYSEYTRGHNPNSKQSPSEETRIKRSKSLRIRFGNLTDRFKERVGKKDNNECMHWLGSINSDGYGTIKYSGKHILAHRLAYEIANDGLLENMIIMHTCDVRDCVNPKHLVLGSSIENRKDCVNKKRHAIGSRHGESKLTEKDVVTIKFMNEMGYNMSDIAEVFKVTDGCISHIINGRTWKHIK